LPEGSMTVPDLAIGTCVYDPGTSMSAPPREAHRTRCLVPVGSRPWLSSAKLLAAQAVQPARGLDVLLRGSPPKARSLKSRRSGDDVRVAVDAVRLIEEVYRRTTPPRAADFATAAYELPHVSVHAVKDRDLEVGRPTSMWQHENLERSAAHDPVYQGPETGDGARWEAASRRSSMARWIVSRTRATMSPVNRAAQKLRNGFRTALEGLARAVTEAGQGERVWWRLES